MSLRWIGILLTACVCLAQTQAPPPKKAPPKKTAQKPPETFVQWLARVTGLSATSGSFRGGPVDVAGDLWIGWINQPGTQRLTFEGGWSWPVFSPTDKEIIAIREGALWSIPVAGGDPVKLPHSPNGIKGVLGAGKDGLAVFTDIQIGLFQPNTGSFTPYEAAGSEDQADIARARRPHESDLHESDQLAAEPSVSHDGRRIIYIRSQ